MITPQGTQEIRSGPAQTAYSSLTPSASWRSNSSRAGDTGILRRDSSAALYPGGSRLTSRSAISAAQGSPGLLSSDGAGAFNRTISSAHAQSLRGANVPALSSGLGGRSRTSASAVSVSATVPSLQSSGRISSSSFPVPAVWSDYNAHYYSNCATPYHHGYPYGYCHGYPYSWSFGVSFGYPYYGFGYCGPSYAYWGYPCYWSPYWWNPWPTVTVVYPYWGYYSVYPYPYLDYYDYYDCDFYRSYYVRFGYYRTSYYVECSGLGHHRFHCHHCHSYYCPVHGLHYYHVGDCELCYPSGGSPVYHDVEVPEVTAPPVEEAMADQASPTSSEGSAGAASDSSVASTAAEIVPLERDEAFFASLKPAQLSFVLGLIQLEHGEYDNAVESFYNGSLEDPKSRVMKLFLGTSLASVGEYSFAAEYLRLALEGWKAFPSYRFSVRELYADPGELDTQLGLLAKELQLNPANTDALLLLGFFEYHVGDVAGSCRHFEALSGLSEDPLDQAIAGSYLAQVDRHEGSLGSSPVLEEEPAVLEPEEEAVVQAFLAGLSLGDVPTLPIR